jgi:hypothetical protein
MTIPMTIHVPIRSPPLSSPKVAAYQACKGPCWPCRIQFATAQLSPHDTNSKTHPNEVYKRIHHLPCYRQAR